MDVSVLFDSNADAVLEIHSPGEAGKKITADCIVEIDAVDEDSVLDEDALLGTDSVLGGESESFVDELLDEIPAAEDIGPVDSVEEEVHEMARDVDVEDLDIFGDDSEVAEGNILDENSDQELAVAGFDEEDINDQGSDSEPASDVNAFFAAFTDDDEEASNSNANALNPEGDL